MKIFLSWSGNLSKSVAEILRKYLPTILQGTESFLSAHDIESGAKWSQILSDELENTNYGILCLTPYNLESKWLIFEAGAISKLKGSSVCGLLIGDLRQTDIESPLSQFQNRRFVKSDLYALLADINKKTTKPLELDQLSLLFNTFWPKIQEEYNLAIDADAEKSHRKRERTDRELIEEILFRLRGIEKQEVGISSYSEIPISVLLDMPVNYETLSAYSKERFPNLEISERWQKQLLADLDTQTFSSIRDIENALNRAMPAVEKFAKEVPELFKSSTGYLTKSLGFVDQNFRDVHPWSRDTERAFQQYGDLLKPL